MSIRNLTEPNNITIYTDSLVSGNIYTKTYFVEVNSFDGDFDDVISEVLSIRIGDYMICNGKSTIIMKNSITPKTDTTVEIKILDIDPPFNIITKPTLIGGGATNTLNDISILSSCDLETPTSVVLSYTTRIDNKFTPNSTWEISYCFSYKLSTL